MSFVRVVPNKEGNTDSVGPLSLIDMGVGPLSLIDMGVGHLSLIDMGVGPLSD